VGRPAGNSKASFEFSEKEFGGRRQPPIKLNGVGHVLLLNFFKKTVVADFWGFLEN
jgi:hypothetical protein